jgi:hypothetical protein
MSAKKGRKSKGEGNTSDRSENISEDDDTGQEVDTLSTRCELTSAMPAFEQGDLRPPASPDISTVVFSTSRVVSEGQHPPSHQMM